MKVNTANWGIFTLSRPLFIPEHPVDTKLVHLVNENYQIVTENFAHGLVLH